MAGESRASWLFYRVGQELEGTISDQYKNPRQARILILVRGSGISSHELEAELERWRLVIGSSYEGSTEHQLVLREIECSHV